MPTQTFFNLSEEKKNKILNSAKHEFSRVPLAEASIQNIVQNADIARGSFYQYFNDKNDLFEYLVFDISKNIIDKVISKFEEEKDIFKTYIYFYEENVNNIYIKEDVIFLNMFFKNIKHNDPILDKIQKGTLEKKMKELLDVMDITIYNIDQQEDLKILMKMLNVITIHAIVESVKSKPEEKETRKEEFLKEISFIKDGVLKK